MKAHSSSVTSLAYLCFSIPGVYHPITTVHNTLKERMGSGTSTADGQFWNVEDLVEVIRERYKVEYQSRSSYVQLLRRCGFSYQKTEKVFKSRSEMKVADFEEQLEKN